MNYEEFSSQLQRELQARLPEGVELHRQEVLKQNGCVKDGLMVSYPNSQVAPTLYIDDMYRMQQDGLSIDEITDNMVRVLAEGKANAPEMPELTAEEAREHLYCAVLSKSENSEILAGCPHEDLADDLAVVARYKVGNNGSFLVRDEACRTLKMTPEEVMEAAHRNTDSHEYQCRPLSDVLRDLLSCEGMPEPFVDEVIEAQAQTPLWFMSTGEPDGAAIITSKEAMQEAHRKIGEDYYVLPSSRHEVLLVPQSTTEDLDFLKSMVRDVNATVLEKTDKLSDSVYKYDGRKLSLADAQVKTKEAGKGLAESVAKAATSHHKH